ncbi:MAG: hypothetical protein K9M80_04885 [Candidatus Marinimicrobia bacterium]|nr:hypothetical protein [Candidatus Neomarinimicrobiota bacterium]
MGFKYVSFILICILFVSCAILDDVNVSDAVLELYGSNPYRIYDGGANGTDGNDDAIISPGESARIQIRATNSGEEEADDVTMTIRTNDEYVSIASGASQTIGDIQDGYVYESPEANTNSSILLTTKQETPNGHIVEFDVRFKDDISNSWSDEFSIVIEPTGASVGLYGDNPYDIYDGTANGADGDDDGSISAGETARLQLRVHNQGNAKAMQVQMLVSSNDEYVTIIDDSTYTFGDMRAGEVFKTSEANSNSAIMVEADSATPSGHIAEIDIICTDKYNNEWTDRFEIIVQ